MKLNAVCIFILKKLAERPRDWFILETEIAPELLADGVSEYEFTSAVDRLHSKIHIKGEVKRLRTGRTTESDQGRRNEIITEAKFRTLDKSTIPEALWNSPRVHKTRRKGECSVRALQITVDGFLAIESADVQDTADANELLAANRHNAALSGPKQTAKQTIEQTIQPAKTDDSETKLQTGKKPWTQLATDLKTKWFAAMQKKKEWIPRNHFLIDFFNGTEGQRNKWKGVNAGTEDKRFSDNPEQWKAESDVLKVSLKKATQNRR